MLRRGIVVETHPEDYSVDLVMTDDGSRVTGAQLINSNANSDSGDNSMPLVKPASAGQKWDINAQSKKIIAIVGYLGNNPVVIGFMYPQVNQILFKDGRWIRKTDSDFYETVSATADMEMVHPSGWYLRVGESPDHEDLTGKNFDGNFSNKKNSDREVFFRLYMPNGNAILTIAPDGSGTFLFEKDFRLEADNIDLIARKTMNLSGKEQAKLTSETNVTVDAPDIDLGV